jgi:hypothetical protein
VRAVQLELTDAQQRLRLAEQAGAEARADIFRLKQEQHEDARATEVRLIVTVKFSVRLPTSDSSD